MCLRCPAGHFKQTSGHKITHCQPRLLLQLPHTQFHPLFKLSSLLFPTIKQCLSALPREFQWHPQATAAVPSPGFSLRSQANSCDQNFHFLLEYTRQQHPGGAPHAPDRTPQGPPCVLPALISPSRSFSQLPPSIFLCVAIFAVFSFPLPPNMPK